MITLTFYRSRLTRRWHYRITAANGEPLARQTQGVKDFDTARHSAELVVGGWVMTNAYRRWHVSFRSDIRVVVEQPTPRKASR